MEDKHQHTYAIFEKLATTPVGGFCSPDDFSEASGLSPSAREVPILNAVFPKLATAPRADNLHVGWGTLQLPSNAWALTFRVQFGDVMHYWLANASDTDVWAAMDAWTTKGKMVIASTFPNGKSHLSARNFEMHPELNKLRSLTRTHDRHLRDFLEGFACFGIAGTFSQTTSSDLRHIRALKHVHARVVSTAQTPAAEELSRIQRDLQSAFTSSSMSLAPTSASLH